MATYAMISAYVEKIFGVAIHHTCWIADVKARHNLTTRVAHNRRGAVRVVPCPPNIVPKIEAALRHFDMIA